MVTAKRPLVRRGYALCLSVMLAAALVMATSAPAHALEWDTYGMAGTYAQGTLSQSKDLTRVFVNGYVKDTKADNKAASVYIIFYGANLLTESRVEHVVTSGGKGSTRSFHLNSGYTRRVEVKECIDNASSFETCGPHPEILITLDPQ